uniref:Uncharacterized protein n=1 Tax=Parascaris equorum TaxID=6256 RepID=A0A914RFC6_PAREQ
MLKIVALRIRVIRSESLFKHFRSPKNAVFQLQLLDQL